MKQRTQEKSLEEMLSYLQKIAGRSFSDYSDDFDFPVRFWGNAPKSEFFPFPYGSQSMRSYDWFQEDEERFLKEIKRDAA